MMIKMGNKLWCCSISLLFFSLANGQKVIIRNNRVQRILSFDGKVWRTTGFASKNKDIYLSVKSDEVNILPMDSAEGLSIRAFQAIGKPEVFARNDSSFLIICYKPIPSVQQNPVTPQQMIITYYAAKNDDFIRKKISLMYNKPATVDRLEVERFIVNGKAAGGGRGQPVFVNDQWFFGLEYPAGYSRHTDGNTPKNYARHFEKVGNYSFIDLQGRDIEPKAIPGMLRLMHFPGYTKKITDSSYRIESKTAVVGFTQAGESVTHAFMQYLSTIWKAPRSFLHYNNWFDAAAKDLSGDALLNVWRTYRKNISPYGVKLDAMVADNGWQDRNSIWQPSPKYFPKGDESLAALSKKLSDAGVGFGLWLSLNGYVNNIDWGVKNDYHAAKPNAYFKQFGSYYSLSADKYKAAMLQRLPELAKTANLVYFKHDFNELSDVAEGNNHPPDDRHGHEANVDAAIELLQATSKARPGIIQNMTNWIWFSPWWLQYADYLWMLAGDDGKDGNWPELSAQARATTDRDTYIWRMWGDSADRPLVPISRLMTHGIIRSKSFAKNGSEDNLQDWLEYVLMYYGRGTLLKEWYISPSAMSPDEWKGLCLTNNWAKQHQAELANTVFVGGRPDEGNAYGYIGWEKDKAVLVVRNPNAATQQLVIPFNASVGFYGRSGDAYKANIVFPYCDIYPKTFISGKDIVITIPGYATMAMELSKGAAKAKAHSLPEIKFNRIEDTTSTTIMLNVPADAKSRCDLLLIGYPSIPAVLINNKHIPVKRSAKASLNHFASYAKAGMISEKAKEWNMVSYDLLPFAGQTIAITFDKKDDFESYLLTERKIRKPVKAITDNNHLWPVTNDTRRQTVRLCL